MNSFTFNVQFFTDLCVITTRVVLDGYTVDDVYSRIHGSACRQLTYDIGDIGSRLPEDLEYEIELDSLTSY
jgi:hypothetical protein